jgi:hypothetical protein
LGGAVSIISKIPDNSRVRYPVVRFVSDNLNGLGQYNWENAGNTLVTLIDNMSASNIYLIERVSFFANVAEAEWLGSMLAPINFPRIALQFNRIGGASIYAEPFRCVNYVDNNEQLIYFRALQNADVMAATMFGQVQQTAGMVGMVNLLAQFNLTVYEITDRKWIDLYERDPARLGSTLRV